MLDNTTRDGYYYLYGTRGACYCYRSKNLMDWEEIGSTINISEGSEISKVLYTSIWAPEVVYDSDTELYYMFFSATPEEDTNVVAGEGVESGTPTELLLVATSKYPDKDFRLVDFKNVESCGEDNLHTYNETAGVVDADSEYKNAYPHYYAKYLMFDPDIYRAFSVANGRTNAGANRGGYEGAIDPHPYVDENGDKYLFWVDSTGPDRICGVKMINWLQPDWSTATTLTYHSYYTVADWKAEQQGASVERVSYELSNVSINEGPTVVKHNDKYYLTFSVNSYKDNTYQIAQAVSDSVLGNYRKLTEEEGGILLSGYTAGSQEVSGTGHHSFVIAGKQTYMVYHRHDDVTTMGAARNPAIDEVRWITITDKNGKELDVMYVNGPTSTMQPKIEAYSDYRNLATEAVVSGTSDTSYLTDGLLSIYKNGNPAFINNIKETNIQETTTFTFDFRTLKTIRAILIYNSKMETTMFKNIKKIEIVRYKNLKEVIHTIENVEFSSEYYKEDYIIPGSAVYVIGKQSNVKAIRITVGVPEGQESVGISEVRILGQ